MPWKPDYITSAELTAFARTDAADDAEAATVVTTVSRAIDKHCNRQFGQVAAAEQRFYTPRFHCRRGLWIVDIDDLMTTTGLTVATATGTITEFDLEPRNAAAKGEPWTRIVIRKADTITIKGDDNEFQPSAKWGWTAVPVPVKQAAKLQGNRLLARRDSPYGVAGSQQQGSEVRLLARLDPDVAVILTSAGLVRPRRVG